MRDPPNTIFALGEEYKEGAEGARTYSHVVVFKNKGPFKKHEDIIPKQGLRSCIWRVPYVLFRECLNRLKAVGKGNYKNGGSNEKEAGDWNGGKGLRDMEKGEREREREWDGEDVGMWWRTI